MDNTNSLLINEVSRTITVEISGGGGGPGNANANSRCTGQWLVGPTALTGKTGALGGYGGRGSRLVGTLTYGAGTLSWELGQGGNVGFNRRAGDNTQGTTGNDPLHTQDNHGRIFPVVLVQVENLMVVVHK